MQRQDRLTLAIPPSGNILDDYETQLLQDVFVDDLGLVFRVLISIASDITESNVLHAITISMPDGTSGRAT